MYLYLSTYIMDIAPHEVSQSMRLEHPETHGSCLLAALVISRQKDKQAEIQKDQGTKKDKKRPTREFHIM